MATGVSTQTDLQKSFITMLFAFAVSVVAQQIAELLIVLTANWTAPIMYGDIRGIAVSDAWVLLAAGSHSLLALLMLSVSWIMWSRSVAAGHLEDVSEVFSIKFITFLMEVLLVTLYFSLSKSAEGDFAKYTANGKTVGAYIAQVSARPEAMQMMCIFSMFALWDLIVDVVRSPTTQTGLIWWRRMLSFFAGVATYCSVSVVCAVGALIVYLVTPVSGYPIQAVLGDVALISLILLFNQSKTLEHHLFKLFPLQGTRRNTKRIPSVANYWTILILLVLYSASLLILVYYSCFQK